MKILASTEDMYDKLCDLAYYIESTISNIISHSTDARVRYDNWESSENTSSECYEMTFWIEGDFDEFRQSRVYKDKDVEKALEKEFGLDPDESWYYDGDGEYDNEFLYATHIPYSKLI